LDPVRSGGAGQTRVEFDPGGIPDPGACEWLQGPVPGDAMHRKLRSPLVARQVGGDADRVDTQGCKPRQPLGCSILALGPASSARSAGSGFSSV